MYLPYRKELEKASRRMILIHRTDTLIKLIVRTIVRTLKISHAGIFLFNKEKKCYILTISGGKKGERIPPGLVKVSSHSPLVEYFSDDKYNLWSDNFLIAQRIKRVLRRKAVLNSPPRKFFFEQLLHQLTIYQVDAALPIVFLKELLGILILGKKKNSAPFFPQELSFLSILSSDVAMAIRNASLFEELRLQLERNQRLFFQTILALASAVEAKDRYTRGHTQRVVEYSLIIAEYLKKERRIKAWNDFKERLKTAALLHDIGKIGVPEEILNKKDKLTPQEMEVVKKHSLIGEQILAPIGDLEEVATAIKYHHERYDGKGYPAGLEGRRIPLISSIIAVADAYDAMTSDRPYRKALPKERAYQIILESSGLQFHPHVVNAFARAFLDKRI